MRKCTLRLFRSRNLASAGGGTLYFHTAVIDRRHPPDFFEPHEVPEFTGESAWFEAERQGRRWRIIRRVDERGAAWPGDDAGGGAS